MKTIDAIALFGSGRKLAIELGITDRAVYQWGEEMPHGRLYQLKEVWVARITKQMGQLNIILKEIELLNKALSLARNGL